MPTKEEIRFITECIDLDTWKHSYHNDVRKCNQKSMNSKLVLILNKKISERNSDIEMILNAIKILSNIDIVEDEIEDKTSDEENLPF